MQALSLLTYFSADDDVAIMSYRAFCDIDGLVDGKHDSEIDLASNLAALFRFYGTSGASLAFPSLVFPIQGKNGGKGEGTALTGSELFVSEGDIYPAMDSVVRFTQALRVFARIIRGRRGTPQEVGAQSRLYMRGSTASAVTDSALL